MDRRGLLLLAAVLVTACTSRSSAHTPLPSEKAGLALGVEREGAFVAYWQASNAAVAIKAFSLKDGHELGTVVNVPQWPVDVIGPHRATDGSLWYAVTTGPRLRSNVAGGDPAPNSCTGSIIRFDPSSGKSQTVLQAPNSELIGDAVPSPDGKRLAYLAGGCDTSYFNMHLVVRDLGTGKESTIGTHAMPCHLITTPSWSADGSKLTFAYGPSPLSPGSTFVPHGTCNSPLQGQLAIVPSSGSSEIAGETLISAAPGCGYSYTIFDKTGVVAVQTCGENGLGAAQLVQLNPTGKVIGRFDLHPGSDPTTLSADETGTRVLVDEYEAPEYAGTSLVHGAYVWIQVFDGHRLHTISRYDGNAVGLGSATF